MWLIPLAVLARPRWREFMIWQTGEVAYFIAVWWFIAGFDVEGAKGMTQQWYAAFVIIHILATIWFSGVIIRDIFVPKYDPIRTDGVPEHADDPGGGVLDGAPDRVYLPSARPAHGRHAAPV
jgi:hypothetical protein